jgi:hypothetical protein
MLVAKNLRSILESEMKLITRSIENGDTRELDPNTESIYFLAGIMFAPPHEELAKEKVLNFIGYWNSRAPGPVAFYFCGYSEVKNEFESPISVGDGRMWYFNNDIFVEFLREIEKDTKWKYEGGCQIILVDVEYLKRTNSVRINMDKVIICELDRMIEKKAIRNIASFIERIFQSTNGFDTESIVNKISNHFGLAVAGQAAVDTLKNLVPNNFAPALEGTERAAFFCVKNIRSNSIGDYWYQN